MSRRRELLRAMRGAVVGLAAMSAAGAVRAQSARPLRVIVPYGTGTGADVTARLVSQRLAERLGHAVIIENKPGASAIVGVQALKIAPPDGSTIGIIVSSNAAQPWLVKNLPFDLRQDFIPITILYEGPLVMTVNAGFPARSLAEFVAHVRAHPGKVAYGTLGTGTTTHLAAELLAQAAGLEMVHVPFKGSGEIHGAVAEGSVQMSFDNYVSPRGLIDVGKLRMLAVTSRSRMVNLPDVPTLAESYPGVELGFWTGFAAPAGTPPELLRRLTEAIRATLNEAEIRARIGAGGSSPGGGPPEDFAALINADIDRFGRIIRTAGIRPE